MTSSRPSRALQVLGRLRSRRRRLRGMDGLLRLLLVAVMLIWATFLLDWSLELPLGIRAFHLFAAAGVLVLGLRLFFWGPRRRLTEAQLAAQVEEADGELEQALITAVQLTDPQNPRASLYSPVLIARTVRDAEKRVDKLRTGVLLSRRGMLTSLFLFASGLVPLLGGGLLRPDLAETYLDRNFFLNSNPWPREYHLRVVEPRQEDTLLAMGDPLTILVEKTRGGSARVWLNTEFDGGRRESFPLEKKGEMAFRRVFRNVDRNFSFQVSSGDYRSVRYRVEVRNRPRIEEIAVAFDYPDYTGIADVTEPSAELGGHVKVPVGTTISYRARASIPLDSVTFVKEYRAENEDRADSETLELRDRGLAFAGSFLAERNGSYHFRLVSRDRFENPSPIRYRIGVVPDHPPSIQIVKPGKTIEVSVRARFPLEIQAQDDYGIDAAWLKFEGGGSEGDASQEVTIALEELESGSRSATLGLELDLEQWESRGGWKPEVGSRIQYSAEAKDAIGQQGSSRSYNLTIVSVEDLERLIGDEIALEGERLQETHDYQKEAIGDVEKILDETLQSNRRVPESQMPHVRHSRLSQEKINTRLEESLEHFHEIVDRIVQNRLSGVQELPKIQELQRKLQEIIDDRAPGALSALDSLTSQAGDGQASADDVEEALARQRQLEKSLRELIDQLKEWGDLRTLVRKLEELRRSQKELEAKVEDKVRGRDNPK